MLGVRESDGALAQAVVRNGCSIPAENGATAPPPGIDSRVPFPTHTLNSASEVAACHVLTKVRMLPLLFLQPSTGLRTPETASSSGNSCGWFRNNREICLKTGHSPEHFAQQVASAVPNERRRRNRPLMGDTGRVPDLLHLHQHTCRWGGNNPIVV